MDSKKSFKLVRSLKERPWRNTIPISTAMPESSEMPSTSTSPTSATKTPAVEKSPSAVVVEKRHFADVRSPPAGQERRKLLTPESLKSFRQVRTYVTDTRRPAAERSQPSMENNGSAIEQNPFITSERKKLMTLETHKSTSFDDFTKYTLPNVSIPEDEEVELLPLKGKSSYVPASVGLETHPGVQRAMVPSCTRSVPAAVKKHAYVESCVDDDNEEPGMYNDNDSDLDSGRHPYGSND